MYVVLIFIYERS